MSEREFWRATPRQFSFLMEIRRRRDLREEFLAAQQCFVAAAAAGAKDLTIERFMPSAEGESSDERLINGFLARGAKLGTRRHG